MNTSKTPRCIATFTPQEWDENDYAVDVEPGTTQFDVTDQIDAMGPLKALQMEDARESTDDLIRDANVPEWIRQWEGPYYVRVRESVVSYLAEKGFLRTAKHRPEIDSGPGL